MAGTKTKSPKLPKWIADQLQDTPEQRQVIGPLVEFLVKQGWEKDQIVFGKKEWRVPKRPSEATKREKGRSFEGFPVDIAVFDAPEHRGDPHHLLFIVEGKEPNETAGLSQLDVYMGLEPHPVLGLWSNNPAPSAEGIFVYRKPDGVQVVKRRRIKDLPRPGEKVEPEAQQVAFDDLVRPTKEILKKTIEAVLDDIVSNDAHVNRREEQLDQLCNLLLLKLESDKEARSSKSQPVFFRPYESHSRTATAIRKRYTSFVQLYPEVFTQESDKKLRFSDSTIGRVVEALSELRMIDLAPDAVSYAFQVVRSEALKQGEGQYFTPQPVIEAAIRMLGIGWDDIIIDPACGTGGFLIGALLELQRTRPEISQADLSRWAQRHLHGIDKDAIGVKITKAVMQISGDGSANCAQGDSVRTHLWTKEYPHLLGSTFKDDRFSVVVTNPPFGQNLKVSAKDCRLNKYTIARNGGGSYNDREIGLVFMERAYRLLRVGGRLGIVLPETYFFSTGYAFLFDWLKPRFRPTAVINVPMEAFQGFCRAKTNFYIFEKIADVGDDDE